MRLLWKKYDSNYDPIIAINGLLFFLGGIYMLVLIGRNTEWTIWVLRCIPIIIIAMGATILVRQFQLRSKR
jgi:hypothetical protein